MVVHDVDLHSDIEYSHDEALSLWEGYLEGDVTPEDVLLYVKRHVILRLRQRFDYRLSDDECEDVVQDALMTVWSIIQKRQLPRRRSAFVVYLSKAVLRCMYESVREIDREDEEPFWIEGYARAGEPTRSQEVGLYVDDLPALIRQGVLKHVLPARLDRPPKAKEAVRYIVDRLVNREKIRKDWLSRHYRISNPAWLVGYVKIRIRQVLWEIAEDFPHRKDRETLLNEGRKLLETSS